MSLEEDVKILRELLWLSHGHDGLYGDDGEMQCSKCLFEYGFSDWKRTPVKEIAEKIQAANIKKFTANKSLKTDGKKHNRNHSEKGCTCFQCRNYGA